MQVKAANKPAEDEFINAKYFSKRRYHEHPEEYPVLRLEVNNPEAIEDDSAKILILEEEDKLLIEFVRAYPDGYMNLDETYLYPGEDYWLQINYNGRYDAVRFSLKREVILNAEITLSVGCATREIQPTGTKGILLDDETTMKHGELEESEEDS